jgi:predicted transporter
VSAETLPFTGVSLLGTFVVSLGLIGAGIFLRRRERRR